MSIDTSKVASTNATTPAKASKSNPVGAVATYVDDRTGLATAMKKQVDARMDVLYGKAWREFIAMPPLAHVGRRFL